tara:strand:- start:3126 stop:3293 length:168 start_codon:yes stop_codon:yes gene_type:complete
MTKYLFDFLIKSNVLQAAIAISMIIIALSFGGSLFIQAKNGCFNKIFTNIIKEID